MMLDFLMLSLSCAPSVHPDTMYRLVRVESSFNPYAIGALLDLSTTFPCLGARRSQTDCAESTKPHLVASTFKVEAKYPAFGTGLGHLQVKPSTITVVTWLAHLGHGHGSQLVEV